VACTGNRSCSHQKQYGGDRDAELTSEHGKEQDRIGRVKQVVIHAGLIPGRGRFPCRGAARENVPIPWIRLCLKAFIDPAFPFAFPAQHPIFQVASLDSLCPFSLSKQPRKGQSGATASQILRCSFLPLIDEAEDLICCKWSIRIVCAKKHRFYCPDAAMLLYDSDAVLFFPLRAAVLRHNGI
jgi:hypothetical protein